MRSPPALGTNLIYFLIKNIFTISQALAEETLKNILKSSWPASRDRQTIQSDNFIIIKKAPQVQRIYILRTQGAKFQGKICA